MRVVVVSEAGGLAVDAGPAAEAAARGWATARPGDEVRPLPLSSGGAGLLTALEACVDGAQRRTVEVANARGYATETSWLHLPDGAAVVESALACGWQQLPAEQRNPRLTTSYGVGQLLLDALDAGVPRIVVGLGDSAALDGGAGLATALGHRLLRTDGNRVKVGGEFLDQVERIAARQAPRVPVTAACDHAIPLLGPTGAVADATWLADTSSAAQPADRELLERNLARLADVAERDLEAGPWRGLPGAGAGGGMGFGLAAFAGAKLTPGAQWFADAIGLAEMLAGADTMVLAAAPAAATALEAKRLAQEAGIRVLDLNGRGGPITNGQALAEAAERLARSAA